MRAIKFNKQFRESFRNTLADLKDDWFDASFGEHLIRSLVNSETVTPSQGAILHRDLEKMLNYRVRAWNAGVMAERIANGGGWHA